MKSYRAKKKRRLHSHSCAGAGAYVAKLESLEEHTSVSYERILHRPRKF